METQEIDKMAEDGAASSGFMPVKKKPLVITHKPNRRTLLKVISELQHIIGQAKNYHGDDRDRMGFENGQKLLEEAFNLCVESRKFD